MAFHVGSNRRNYHGNQRVKRNKCQVVVRIIAHSRDTPQDSRNTWENLESKSTIVLTKQMKTEPVTSQEAVLFFYHDYYFLQINSAWERRVNFFLNLKSILL